MSQTTLIDSNILIDVANEDPHWFEWSAEHLAIAADHGPIGINPLIYAEFCQNFQSAEEADNALPPEIERFALPYEAGFPASEAFVAYRKRGGARRSPLPDFYIGAHAHVHGMRLLTRDVSRFRTYFPDVELICPE